MGQDHADVVPAAAEDGVDRIAGRALEGAAGEATVGFHVTDCRLDGTGAAQVAPERGGHAATLPGDEDLGCLYAVTTRAAIDEGARGAGALAVPSRFAAMPRPSGRPSARTRAAAAPPPRP